MHNTCSPHCIFRFLHLLLYICQILVTKLFTNFISRFAKFVKRCVYKAHCLIFCYHFSRKYLFFNSSINFSQDLSYCSCRNYITSHLYCQPLLIHFSLQSTQINTPLKSGAFIYKFISIKISLKFFNSSFVKVRPLPNFFRVPVPNHANQI